MEAVSDGQEAQRIERKVGTLDLCRVVEPIADGGS